jgi:hypothetical protein
METGKNSSMHTHVIPEYGDVIPVKGFYVYVHYMLTYPHIHTIVTAGSNVTFKRCM